MVGRPDLKPRLHDRPNTDQELAGIFLRHTRDEWFDMIRRHGTQGAPVLSLAEALNDPHTRARGNIVETTTEQGETILHIAPLIKLSQTPGSIRHLARMPGQDTRSVLQGLGYSSDEIVGLMNTD
jgi:crotonobetainyl-CoA:carnitine CoA-transferase CaiB-like acyl-CoA transferase